MTSRTTNAIATAGAIQNGTMRPFGVSFGCTFLALDLVGLAYVVTHLATFWHLLDGLVARIP